MTSTGTPVHLDRTTALDVLQAMAAAITEYTCNDDCGDCAQIRKRTSASDAVCDSHTFEFAEAERWRETGNGIAAQLGIAAPWADTAEP